jgi:hypothetical protein
MWTSGFECSDPRAGTSESMNKLAMPNAKGDGAGDGTRIRLYIFAPMSSYRNSLITNGGLSPLSQPM